MVRIVFTSFLIASVFALGAAFCDEKKVEKTDGYAWQSIFDGKSLKGWTVPRFGGDGDVKVENGNLVLGQGAMMTGVKYENVFPQLDYEIRYEAKRTQGSDFFAALTFPYKDSACTFVNGGWGGGTIGLSCIDDQDASENETGGFHSFQDDKWYQFRVRVTADRINVWVDEQTKEGKRKETKLVDLEVKERKISLRNETSLFGPLGICTWVTEGRVRGIEYRKLKPEESERVSEW